MKFFKKYYLVLPPVALIYGIYILNIKYPYDGFPQTLMDSIINGWLLIWVLFAALSGGIIYQLQQSKKQQYIYSLPWTKKDIYKKSASWPLFTGSCIKNSPHFEILLSRYCMIATKLIGIISIIINNS